MTHVRVAVAGASGYAGGELLRLLLGHPDVEIGALTAGSNAGETARRRSSRTWCRWPTGCSRRPPPRPSPVTTWSSSPCRTASPAPSPRQLGRRHRGRRLRRRLPAHRRGGSGQRFYGGDARRHLALRPARAARPARRCCAGARRIAVPGCYPTVSTLALAPGRRRRPGRRRDVVVVAASGTSGAGKAAKPHLLGSEVMGTAIGVRRRRHAPAHPRDRAEPRGARPTRRCGSASRPLLVPMPRGILATCSAPLRRRASTADDVREAYPRRTTTSRSCTCCRRGSGRRPRPSHGSQRRATCRSPSTRRAGRLVVVGAIDNLDQGHRRRRRPVHEPRPRPRRDPRPHHGRGRAVSVTAPQRLPGRRRRRRAEVHRRHGRRAGRQRRARRTPPPRVFTANRCKANPVLWSEEVVKDGVVRAVVLNSGGANCYTGPEGFQTTHAVAERVAERLGIGADRRRRLLDRPDRPRQRPRRRCSPASTRRTARWARTGGGDDAAARDHDHRHASPSRSSSRAPAGRSAAWPRAPGCSPPSWPRCSSSSPPTPSSTADDLDAALRAATRVSFDRLDSDGCMSTNDTVTAAGQRRQRDHARRLPDFTDALTRACTDLAMQLLADAEGADHEIAITVLHAATEDDAVEVGRSIARSNLFKAAVFGNDPNWGRVLAAHRHHAGGVRPGRPRRRDERRLGLPAVDAGRADPATVDLEPPRGHASPSTSRPATPGRRSGPTT